MLRLQALNDFENYRTESEYRTNLIIKVFSFRFVCYFATLYYYAFVSVGTKQAIENGILRVGTGVLVYTTVAHWWQIILQIGLPLLIRKVRMHYRGIKLCNSLREIEMQEEHVAELDDSTTPDEIRKHKVKLVNKRLLLEQAQDEIWLELMLPAHDSFNEYVQAIVLFTFVTCFSVVLPITPLICLINYLISMRLDAHKLCRGRRRPLAEKTGGIGVWLHLMHIVAVISVLTNCWLMGFTNEMFVWIGEQIGQLQLLALVVAWEHIMLLIKYIMQTSISPLPKSVQDAIKKEKHLIDEQRTKELRDRQQDRRAQYQHDEIIPVAANGNNGSQRLSSVTAEQNHQSLRRRSGVATNGSRSISWGSSSSGPSSFDTTRDQMLSPLSSNTLIRTPSASMMRNKQDFDEEVASGLGALYSA
jgi:Calcium-activated chloride channel